MAFFWAEKILKARIRQACGKNLVQPAPVVCHLTDAEYTNGHDPETVIQRILKLKNEDGNVLVCNIYLGEDLTTNPIKDIQKWAGISSEDELKSDYAKKLFRLSSLIPASYLQVIRRKMECGLKENARMFFPGNSLELLKLGFTVSTATPFGEKDGR